MQDVLYHTVFLMKGRKWTSGPLKYWQNSGLFTVKETGNVTRKEIFVFDVKALYKIN